MRLAFDAWVPSTHGCEQRVTFRVGPSISGEQPAPTGKVRLVSDAGATIGSVPVTGFGTHTVTGACASTADLRYVALVYDGDATYPSTSVWSPDKCPRDAQTPSQEQWNIFVGGGTPRPVFWCQTGHGFSIRSEDGRMYAGGGSFGMIPSPWEYGQRAEVTFDVEGDPDRQPMAPTGVVEARIDGLTQQTFSIDADRNAHTWVAETGRLQLGTHRWTLEYSGDARWAPEMLAQRSFTLVKALPSGRYGVADWTLTTQQRPKATIKFRNAWTRAAKAPTGKVDFYVGSRHVHETRLRPRHHGRRTVSLPPVRRKGMHLLRVVYRGDSRYRALDSAGQDWFSSTQYLKIR